MHCVVGGFGPIFFKKDPVLPSVRNSAPSQRIPYEEQSFFNERMIPYQTGLSDEKTRI
jgi:hypothetical protein